MSRNRLGPLNTPLLVATGGAALLCVCQVIVWHIFYVGMIGWQGLLPLQLMYPDMLKAVFWGAILGLVSRKVWLEWQSGEQDRAGTTLRWGAGTCFFLTLVIQGVAALAQYSYMWHMLEFWHFMSVIAAAFLYGALHNASLQASGMLVVAGVTLGRRKQQ